MLLFSRCELEGGWGEVGRVLTPFYLVPNQPFEIFPCSDINARMILCDTGNHSPRIGHREAISCPLKFDTEQ